MKIIRSAFTCLVLFAFGAGLASCAAESNYYPSLPTAAAVKLKNRILSREEQEEAIRNLSAEQAEHESTETIEKSP